MYSIFKKVSISVFLLFISLGIFAQETVNNSTTDSGLWEAICLIDKLLILIAIALLIPIYYLSRIFNWSLKHYLSSKLNNKLNSAVWILILSAPGFLLAQNNSMPASSEVSDFNYLRWFLITVILLETFVVGFFGKMLYNQFESIEENVEPKAESKNWLLDWWNKVNNFGAHEEENKLDIGHNYDGIRELDNNIPVWFTAAFVACVLFAVIYMYQYHIAKILPLSDEEFKIEMEEAELAHQEYLKNSGSKVDENNLALSTEKTDLEEGKKLFAANCVACHLSDGGGLQGPNLTDDNWILGCADKDIYKTIKYGGTKGAGMQAWNSIFNDNQILQLASYVKSLHGTKPANPKAPQGSPCSMLSTANMAAADSTVQDSIKK